MATIELSDRELELVHGALMDWAKSLGTYRQWVDDRPALPTVEAALGRIDAEVLETRKLSLRIYETWRPTPTAPQPGAE